MERYLSNYIQNYFEERKPSALHVAVSTIQTEVLDLNVIQRFLQLGANPNAKDDNSQTQLYVMAERRVAYSDENLPIFRDLVRAGTHLDNAE